MARASSLPQARNRPGAYASRCHVRILAISPYPVLPPTHGGRVRAYRLAVGVGRAGAKVDLACPWTPGLPRQRFDREGITIRPFVVATNVLPRLLGDRLIPPLVQLSWQPITAAVRGIFGDLRRYDVVEFNFCAHPSWMEFARHQTRVVYAAHNVEHDYALAGSASSIRRRLAHRLGSLEQRAIHASDLVVCCTQHDRGRLLELYGNQTGITVVPNGYDEVALLARPSPSRKAVRAELGLAPHELVILFVGGPSEHNRRAVRLLEQSIVAGLERPARLLIAGECAEPRRDDRVLALGFVPELRPVFAAADVAVNPVVTGSGSNVKLAEYLAAGLPVVTTPFGLRGYEHLAELVTVSDLAGFSTMLQRQRPRVEPLPALAELSWSALGQRLHRVYADLLEAVPRRNGREP